MPYTRTYAFQTQGSAFHGGDPGWFIRKANENVVTAPSYGRPNLAGLGYGEEAAGAASTAASTASTIAQAVQAAAALAQTGEAIYAQRQQEKQSKAQADAANRAADAQEKQNAALVQAQTDQIKAQTASIQTGGSSGGVDKNQKTLLVWGGLGVAALLAVGWIMRRPATAKR